MQRRDVVVIIIRASAMAAPLVQFADFIADLAAIVLRIEDRDAIHGQSDRATQEAAFDHRRFLRHDRLQWDAPRVVIEIRLRQRHLLLPRGDAHHHVVIRQAVRAHIKKLAIRPQIELREGQEGLRRLRRVRGICDGCGCELDDRGRGGDFGHAALTFPLLENVRPQGLPVSGGQIMRGEACREQKEGRESFHSTPY